MRRRPPGAVAAIDTPGPFTAADWLPLVSADVEPMLRRTHARRLWDAAWADWGRANGYDPGANYMEPEGKRWWAFRHGLNQEGN